MNAPRRNRARVLTPDALKQLRERVRSHENEENSGFKYTLERLGELTGLDPETVKNVLDGNGSDKRTIARCFETFGLILTDHDHIPAAPVTAVQADPNFVGRDEAIADLTTLVSRKANLIVIQARGGVGKTTLARKYLQQEFGSYLEFPIAKETKDIASIEGLIEEKLRQLGEEPGREFLVSLDRLKRKLQSDRIGILIDNLEPALDSAGKFIEAHRRYVELLRVLSDPTVKSITLITSRERLREADVTVHHYGLKSLNVQAWSQFFQSRNISAPPLTRGDGGDLSALAALHNAYGGNAKAMDMISGAVLEDFSGNVDAYWQANQADLFIERDLEDLVVKQFARLQQLDPDAYNLLCRMGCYRYQDVPTVPIEGLFCLLWDIPENRHRRVIKSLQDRSLVDCENGEFWLHPVIRAEAIARSRESKDWEITNHKAAEFWTSSIKVVEKLEDAQRAFEACHQYLEINDFVLAANIILKKRKAKYSRFGDIESLGWSFFILGVSKQVTDITKLIAENIKSTLILIEIYSILGDFHDSISQFHQAIQYYDESVKMSNLPQISFLVSNSDKSVNDFQILKFSSFLSRGVCQIQLWQLQESLRLFEEGDLLFKTESGKVYDDFQFRKINLFYFSFLHSLLSEKKAYSLCDELYNEIFLNHIAYLGERLFWATEYRLVFLGQAYKNLGEYEKALRICDLNLSMAEENKLEPIKVRIFYTLAEIYRAQKKFDLAFSNHFKSINLSDRIQSQRDLAEAHYQIGLTYISINELEKSRENFQKAIRLFSEMEAPKQVERVRRSMKN
jgi:tetratricopeptide (TPR) repeat protein